MPPRLKVFVTSDGLTDYVVAVSSRAKALAAWGVRQDLFKEGRAQETDDPALVAEATARPGEVLRRPAAARGELARLTPARPPPEAEAGAEGAVEGGAEEGRRSRATAGRPGRRPRPGPCRAGARARRAGAPRRGAGRRSCRPA